MTRIFVFGSNTEGRHGAGAAKFAKDHYGAIQGVPIGLQGRSYAIITKDLRIGERSVSFEAIKLQIGLLYYFAYKHPEMIFYVTRIGCGHAGYTEDEIAPLFEDIVKVNVDNIKLCSEFYHKLGLTNPVYLWDTNITSF